MNFWVEKSGVETSYNYIYLQTTARERTFQPQVFNHELFNPVIKIFLVKKFVVEKSGFRYPPYIKSMMP